MATYVALLRAVNVAGTTVSMRDLRAVFEAMGFGGVRTYVQSGNVVLDSDLRSPTRVRAAIEEALRSDLGLAVAAVVRDAADLRRVLEANPFPDADPRTLYVTFLAQPARRSLTAADAPAGIPDEFVPARAEIYVHCPGGYGRSKLSNAWFEKRTGVAATTRNWNTVTKLAELAGG
ncbi:MAG: DUF1697 domain-containing protein [Acidimicrobiia bacterium]